MHDDHGGRETALASLGSAPSKACNLSQTLSRLRFHTQEASSLQ